MAIPEFLVVIWQWLIVIWNLIEVMWNDFWYSFANSSAALLGWLLEFWNGIKGFLNAILQTIKADSVSYLFFAGAAAFVLVPSTCVVRELNGAKAGTPLENAELRKIAGVSGMLICLAFTVCMAICLPGVRARAAAPSWCFRCGFILVSASISMLSYYSPIETIPRAWLSAFFIGWARYVEEAVNIPMDLGSATLSITIAMFLKAAEKDTKEVVWVFVPLACYLGSLMIEREPLHIRVISRKS